MICFQLIIWFTVLFQVAFGLKTGWSGDAVLSSTCLNVGELKCSPTASNVEICNQNKQWEVHEECLIDSGKLCSLNKCVYPWLIDTPSFESCANNSHATSKKLHEKAAFYDHLAGHLHCPPTGLFLLLNYHLLR